jgi:lysyl oxidase
MRFASPHHSWTAAVRVSSALFLQRTTRALGASTLLALALAVQAGAQVGPCATPIGPLLPDLIVDRDKLASMMRVEEETYEAGSCTVVEGCVTGPGTHLVLRFMSSTPNIGPVDLVVGDPNNCLGDLFRLSECHGHLHFQEYSDYRLWTLSGYERWVASRTLAEPTGSGHNAALLAQAQRQGELVVGRKQGFCLIDISRYLQGSGHANYQSCSQNQGITAGWADEYHPSLGCQFVQITGLPAGDYVLEDQVNPEQLFPESDYTNNAAAVQIHLGPKHGRGRTVVQAVGQPSDPAGGSVRHPVGLFLRRTRRSPSCGSHSASSAPGR